MEIICGNIRT
jgi:hypothetical protein